MLERSGSIEAFFAEGLADPDVDIGGALDSFSTRALALDVRRGLRARAEARRRLLFLSAAVGGQRLQAAQSVPALDGAQRCSRSRRLDARAAGQLIVPLDTHVIRLGALPAADALHEPGMEDGGRRHRAAARARSRRPGPVRFLALPRRDDERLRLRPPAGRQPMSVERALPPARQATRHPLARLTAAACAAAIALSAACRGGPDDYVVKSSTAPDTHHVALVRLVRCETDWCERLAIGATADGAAAARGAGRERTVQRDRLVARRQARRVRDQRPAVAALRSGDAQAGGTGRSGERATAIRRREWREGSPSRRTARRSRSMTVRARNPGVRLGILALR